MRLLIFLLASIAWGSQSLQINPTAFSASTTTLSGPWTHVSGVEVQGHIWNYVAQVTQVGVLEVETNMRVFIDGSSNLNFTAPAFATSVFLPLGSSVSYRFKARRDFVAHVYTLELWDEVTGAYAIVSAVDPSPSTVYDMSASHISIGSYLEPVNLNAKIGMLRVSSTVSATSILNIPRRFISSGFADMLDLELEANLTDDSPQHIPITFYAGSISYASTTNLIPSVSLSNIPLTVRAGFPAALSIAAWANNDNPSFTSRLFQSAGPLSVAVSSGATLTPSITPPVFGQYDLSVQIADTSGLTNSVPFSIGAVATDSNGVVVVPDPTLRKLLGPFMHVGRSAYSWLDNRRVTSMDAQLYMFTAGGPNNDGPWRNQWSVADSHGTVSVTNGEGSSAKTVVGATNAASTVLALTVTFDLGIVGSPVTILIAGATGSWTPINGTFTGTVVDSTHVSLPVNSLAFGALTGSPTYTYPNYGTVHGTSTLFKDLFCGGGTSPVSGTSESVIWYNSADYPATTGRGFYLVLSCESQTSLTISHSWGHSTGTQSGLSYNMMNEFEAGNWTTFNTPANYYDSVVAFYSLYYATGLTKYRDAARLLANNFWTGPFYDRGKNYDGTAVGGNFISACCGRSEAILGLVLWYLDTGANIWPGLNWVLEFNKTQYTIYHNLGWQSSIPDPRETGFLTANFALCSQFSTDPTWAANCRTYMKEIINSWWAPLQLGTGQWSNVVNDGTFLAADGSVYATVTTGSTAVVLTGRTWSSGNGTLAWFITDKTKVNFYPPGNSDSMGDSTYYTISSADGINLVLDRPYAGTGCGAGCQKGMETSVSLAGFGTEPFMQGISGNQFGSLVYDSLTASGDTTEAAIVRQFSIDSANWIATDPNAYDSSVHGIYFGANFFNCSPPGSDPAHCFSGLPLNGEVLNNLALAFRYTSGSTVRTIANQMMDAMWCKPTGGWTCPRAGYGTYMSDIDSNGCSPINGGYMINCTDPASNKWSGYFFGYGKVQNVEAEFLGGVAPPDPLTLTTSAFMRVGAAKIKMTVLAPDGTISTATCAGTAGTSQGCAWVGDKRQGNHQLKVEQYTSGDVLVGAPGQYQTIYVQ